VGTADDVMRAREALGVSGAFGARQGCLCCWEPVGWEPVTPEVRQGLGNGDVIPFDNGILGAGEFEGRGQTLAESLATVREHTPALRGTRDHAVGQPVSKLVAALRATAPGIEIQRPSECNPLDR
jgi:hypothetical protein